MVHLRPFRIETHTKMKVQRSIRIEAESFSFSFLRDLLGQFQRERRIVETLIVRLVFYVKSKQRSRL